MVLTCVADWSLVSERVVPLLVYKVDERGNLWETLLNGVKQGSDLWLIVLVEDYREHNLACRCCADNNAAHKSLMLTSIVERVVVLDAV